MVAYQRRVFGKRPFDLLENVQPRAQPALTGYLSPTSISFETTGAHLIRADLRKTRSTCVHPPKMTYVSVAPEPIDPEGEESAGASLAGVRQCDPRSTKQPTEQQAR